MAPSISIRRPSATVLVPLPRARRGARRSQRQKCVSRASSPTVEATTTPTNDGSPPLSASRLHSPSSLALLLPALLLLAAHVLSLAAASAVDVPSLIPAEATNWAGAATKRVSAMAGAGDRSERSAGKEGERRPGGNSGGVTSGTDAEESRVYIVRFRTAPPVTAYTGGFEGHSPTAVSSRGRGGGKSGRYRLDSSDKRVVAYSQHVQAMQDAELTRGGVNARKQKLYSYTFALNGAAVRLTPAQAAALRKQAGVSAVSASARLHARTTYTPSLLGLRNRMWRWQDQRGRVLKGEDVIVGVIDTGVWPENPAFSDQVSPPYGPVPARWKGGCGKENAMDFPARLCNGKLVGAKYFMKGFAADEPVDWRFDYASPRDVVGHGTHTSSTAAGNQWNQVTLGNVTFGTASGVAPRARVAIYKVVWAGKDGSYSADTADVVAAIEAAIEDGVDVLSQSLGKMFSSPFDADEIAFLHAAQAGIFTALAAGNMGGQLLSMLDHPSPWYTTVAASDTGRRYATKLTVAGNRTFVGLSFMGHPPLPKAAPAVFPLVEGEAAVGAGQSKMRARYCQRGSLDPGKVRGAILICIRPDSDSVDIDRATDTLPMSRVAAAIGAAGVVIVNAAAKMGTAAVMHPIPACHLNVWALQPLLALLRSTKSPLGSLSPALTVYGDAPTVAAFSSRGPVEDLDGAAGRTFGRQLNDVVKPDVVAPGVEIWAAWTQSVKQDALSSIAPGAAAHMGPLAPHPFPPLPRAGVVRVVASAFNVNTGTSMATPHVAGAAALLIQAHPNWSPFAVKSAIQTSASALTRFGRPIPTESGRQASPFDMGSGHLTPTAAVNPGLVYDATSADMIRFLVSVDELKARNIGAKTAYGKGGSGGRDMQKGSIRTHQRSTAHQDAHAEMKSKESRKLRQTLLSEFEGLDRSTLHIIIALKTTVYICKSEAPITSYVGTIKFMAELGVPNLPLDSKGNYFSEEALAAKDAAEKVTEFNIIDQAVRNVAEQLSRSSNWHRRFEHLQEYICETNLELQGIHDVRWLSRGEAVKRFAKVLPATIVLLHDFKHALYETVTSFKFHFMLFFLADILAVLNELNAKFQKQQVTCGVFCNYSSHAHSQVDITVVAGEVSLACRTIEVRYVDCEDRFGNDQSPLLCAFLKKHGNPQHREVTVQGVDQNGEAAEHEFVLHERKIPGHKTGGDYYSCKVVCQEFARVCVARLEFRLEDLKNLAGSKLFRPSCYPDDNAQRMKKCRECRPSDVSSLPLAMASLPAAEDSPETAPEKPPDHRDSGLDFLRRSVAPVTPEPLVTAAVVNTDVNPSSSKEPQPAPNPAPSPAPFTLLPAIASSSKAPPSAVGSSGCNDAAPASEGRTAKKARTFVLRGKLQQSTLTFGGVRVPPPSAPEEEEPEPEEPEEIPVRADTNSPVLSRAELMEQKYIEASVKYNTQWLPKFPWLLLLRAKDGGPSVKCSVCLSFGKETTKYSGPGDGGRDLQTQTMRIHEHTSVHKEAMQRQAEIAEAISNGQTEIDRFMNADVEGRRAIRLMRSVQFLCQEDTPISMFPKLMRHLAEQDTPDIPKQAYGVYLTREALAVKDTATSNPDLAMVDTVVRTLAQRLGASSHWSQQFKYLQRVIYNTNLEVQGIHSVRWLSRGDAVKRLCKVLGAAIILFHEKEHDLYETVTSYKFQFCLFFLADILGDLNDLNRSFQKRRQRCMNGFGFREIQY
ncbi:unnamed protein product [Closterium sp. Naga37s-1]|nr:unnamed protein product [Closterium sp. Naga37s-1]